MKFQGRKIYAGSAEGEALVTKMGISFYGGVDPDSGIIVERGHELEGQSIAGKSWSSQRQRLNRGIIHAIPIEGKWIAPAAIVNAECETITAVGCIIAEIPCVESHPFEQLMSGQTVRVDGDSGIVYCDQ